MQVKAKSTLQAIASNRLSDGIAVWLGHHGRWVETVGDALALPKEEVPAALERIRTSDRAQHLVDPYAIDVEIIAGATVPLHIRERMKALGPSVRADLGKQAEPAAATAA